MLFVLIAFWGKGNVLTAFFFFFYLYKNIEVGFILDVKQSCNDNTSLNYIQMSCRVVSGSEILYSDSNFGFFENINIISTRLDFGNTVFCPPLRGGREK